MDDMKVAKIQELLNKGLISEQTAQKAMPSPMLLEQEAKRREKANFEQANEQLAEAEVADNNANAITSNVIGSIAEDAKDAQGINLAREAVMKAGLEKMGHEPNPHAAKQEEALSNLEIMQHFSKKENREPINKLESRDPASVSKKLVYDRAVQESESQRESNVSFISDVIVGKHEGGYNSSEDDSGNYVGKDKNSELVGTMYGISADTLKDYLGRTPTAQDMKSLTKDEAMEIYKSEYLDKPKIGLLPKGLRHFIMDFGINSGPSRAIKMLQRQVGVEADGKIGPDTLKAVRDADQNKLYDSLVSKRLDFINRSGKIKERWKKVLRKRINDYKRGGKIYNKIVSPQEKSSKPAVEEAANIGVLDRG